MAAAFVVSRVWGAGTVYGAAATPVIVALVSELLHRPAQAIETVRKTRDTIAFDPVAEGRAGMREGALEAIADGSGDRHVHQVPAARRPRRRTVVAALLTGVLAFGVAAVVLTGGELALGGSSVGGGHARTTLFGGKAHSSSSSTEQRDTTTTTTGGEGTTSTPTTTGRQAQPTTAAGRRDGDGRHVDDPGDAAERRRERASRDRDDDHAGADDHRPRAAGPGDHAGDALARRSRRTGAPSGCPYCPAARAGVRSAA